MRFHLSEIRSIRANAVAALTVLAAILMFIAFCAPHAFAVEVPIRFRHPGGDPRAYDAVRLCDASVCMDLTLAAPCAPGATCTATADLAPGSREHWLRGLSGADESAASNVRLLTIAAEPEPLDPAACLAMLACRMDADGDGVVTGSDFARFLTVFGRSWRP